MEEADRAHVLPGRNVPSPVVYSAEEVARNFEELLACLDAAWDLSELGISALSLFKRRKALQQMTALSIGLWKLTLERSFPQDAEDFFQYFMDNSPHVAGNTKKAAVLRGLVQTYVNLLAEKRDANFSAAAQYMADALSLNSMNSHGICLKISLRVRQLYNFIFAKMI